MRILSLSCLNIFSSIKPPIIRPTYPLIAIISAISLSILALYSVYWMANPLMRAKGWRAFPAFRPFTYCMEKVKGWFSLDRIQRKGHTALTQASSRGDLRKVQQLVLRGASVNQANKDGQTPLLLAAWNGHLDVVDFLLNHQADPNRLDRYGQTALILAAFKGNRTMVERLLKAGSQPNVLTEKGQTLAMVAYNGGYPQLADWLLQQEKSQSSKFWLSLKLFVHKLGLNVHFNFKDPKVVDLTGFDLFSTYMELVRSIKCAKEWMQKAPFEWTSHDSQYIEGILTKGINRLDQEQSLDSKVAEIMEDYRKGEIVVLPIHWLLKKSNGERGAHAASIVIYQNLLIKCDRDNEQPGLIIYQIQKPTEVETVIRRLRKTFRATYHKKLFEEEIDQELDLQRIHYIKHTRQKSPICAWTSSAKSSFHAVLYLYLIKKGLEAKEAENSSQLMYKTWVDEDRFLELQNLLRSKVPPFIKCWLLGATHDYHSRKTKPAASTVNKLTLIKIMQLIRDVVQKTTTFIEQVEKKNANDIPTKPHCYKISFPDISLADFEQQYINCAKES